MQEFPPPPPKQFGGYCRKNLPIQSSNVPQHWIGGVFSARGVSPCQKWWRSLLWREISCSQCEGPSMHSRCLAFFPFMFWGGGGSRWERFFFIFPGFPMCSHYVPFKFPIGSQCFPNIFSIPPHFYPICLGKWCPPFTYIGGPKGRNCTVLNRAFYFGESSLIFFGVMGQSNWHVAGKK